MEYRNNLENLGIEPNGSRYQSFRCQHCGRNNEYDSLDYKIGNYDNSIFEQHGMRIK